eukprot:TRINITY_DN1726_c0_g1_i3.p1 TRINITY_DN1726_c0_g1~~TRINITY_DN1726_c0_g1_i3.p1  ORF type:complete len:210 (+),score=54.83 TRINITY_DN1726_c0_g1_i3:294-923(+)
MKRKKRHQGRRGSQRRMSSKSSSKNLESSRQHQRAPSRHRTTHSNSVSNNDSLPHVHSAAPPSNAQVRPQSRSTKKSQFSSMHATHGGSSKALDASSSSNMLSRNPSSAGLPGAAHHRNFGHSQSHAVLEPIRHNPTSTSKHAKSSKNFGSYPAVGGNANRGVAVSKSHAMLSHQRSLKGSNSLAALPPAQTAANPTANTEGFYRSNAF